MTAIVCFAFMIFIVFDTTKLHTQVAPHQCVRARNTLAPEQGKALTFVNVFGKAILLFVADAASNPTKGFGGETHERSNHMLGNSLKNALTHFYK